MFLITATSGSLPCRTPAFSLWSSIFTMAFFSPLPTLIYLLFFLSVHMLVSSAQSRLCRTSCGALPIRFPLSIDHGCGSPYYRNMLLCTNSSRLLLRTPSGTYPVAAVDYSDPHLVVTDPSMWACPSSAASSVRPANPFSLDTSTRFSLSPNNDYLFFNCNREAVIVEPKPAFCERFPDRCDSACDSAGYLCRNLPGCPEAAGPGGVSCCSYYPKASESLRLMLRHCATYASVYWRTVGTGLPPYDQVPEFGIRVDFEIPVTTRCLQCEDLRRGGGTCGFDVGSRGFLCLCEVGNATNYCTDGTNTRRGTSTAVIAGTTIASVAGAAGLGGIAWYLRKMRKSSAVTFGVQSNENRLF